jgi:hypothetical protein
MPPGALEVAEGVKATCGVIALALPTQHDVPVEVEDVVHTNQLREEKARVDELPSQ